MELNHSDITFVVQGPIVPAITRDCLLSIRQYFADARIILSTWKGHDTTGLTYDELILSDDPGFHYCVYPAVVGTRLNNVNRQIVSCLAGVNRVKTEYAFKIRTDFAISGSSFLKFWNTYNLADENYKIFTDKILACCYFSRNPKFTQNNFPFHPSDLAFFGKTADLLNMFNVPLMTNEEACWIMRKFTFNIINKLKISNRYVPEQHIFINCLRANGKQVACDFFNDSSEDNIVETEKYFVSNFVFLTFEQFNLVPLQSKFFIRTNPNSFRTCYTHNQWLELYKNYVDSSIIVPSVDEESEKIKKFYKIARKYKIIGNILALPFPSKFIKSKIRAGVLDFFLSA